MSDFFAENSAATNAVEYTVSEISGALKRTVEDRFGHVRVRGEISGYRGPHASGHAYFALKDDKARLEAVIWRGVMGKLKFLPEEGMEVIATGKLTTYPGSSKFAILSIAFPTGFPFISSFGRCVFKVKLAEPRLQPQFQALIL